MGAMFGGGNQQQVYPPAPAGFKYVDVRVPQAPPGYHTARMSTIAANPTGLPAGGTGTHRQAYQYGAHTPEGVKERVQENMRLQNAARELRTLQNPGYKPRMPIPPSSPLGPYPSAAKGATWGPGGMNDHGAFDSNMPPSTQLPAVLEYLKNGGTPPAGMADSFLRPTMGSIPNPTPSTPAQKLGQQRRELSLGNTVGNILEKLDRGNLPIAGAPRTPHAPDIDLTQPLPGLPSSAAPAPDNVRSKLDALQGTPEQEADWKWAEGIAASQNKPKTSYVPQVLQDLWKNFTAPVGPAFDPSKVDLGEQRYDPLPEGGQ